MKERVVEFLATGFYSGKMPKAPGTAGTVVAVPIVVGLSSVLNPINYMAVTFVAVIAAIFISQLHENAKGVHDSQEIVIDEIVGYMVAMVWLPMTWQSLLIGFVLFRLFDALKPFPINVIDEKIGGGVGVVVDDVAAGIATNFLMQILFVNTTVLGVQWVTA